MLKMFYQKGVLIIKLIWFATAGVVGLPRWLSGKESACQSRRHGFSPWVGKIPWRRKWQSIPVFLPGKSHGQRNLAGYTPGAHKESDTTQWLNNKTPLILMTNTCSYCYHIFTWKMNPHPTIFFPLTWPGESKSQMALKLKISWF